ncbi:MAG: hypothetical protein QM698_12725 [Micropepsaceae bacterium]
MSNNGGNGRQPGSRPFASSVRDWIVAERPNPQTRQAQRSHWGEIGMRRVQFGVLAVIGAGLALSACGSSAFETKVKAQCEAGGKNGRLGADRYDCGCVASTLAGALNSEDQTIYLAARVDGKGSASDVENGVKKTGVDPKADNEGFRTRLRAFLDAENAAEEKVEASCKKG